MIEQEDYKLPRHEQPKPRPKADPKTMEYLESLPWKPFTSEW